MKKNIIYTTIVAFLFVMFVGIISCDNMNDIQAEFADKEEQVYLGKVDSLKVHPGFGRAKITWFIGSDPKIEQTVIYWNSRQDSIVKNFDRKSSALQKDSIIIENLGERSVIYEFRNKNSKGESSLYSSISVTAWGENFAANLLGRKLVSKEFDYNSSSYKLGLSAAVAGDSVAYSQIVYTDKTGAQKTVKIERNTNEILLSNFSDGAEFQFRNVFFLPQGIDTVYSSFQTNKAPTAVFGNGKLLTLKGDVSSKYFQKDGNKLYEWNSAGDIIVYNLNEDGSFTLSETYPSLVPRTTYREFFFYDDDKFIGISIAHGVYMFRIVDGKLSIVKATSSSAETFGTGFNFLKFLPSKGYFYSVAANGELKTWFANNNATWGSSNGTKVASDILYEPITTYNFQYLLGVDTEGNLWSIPTSSAGTLGSKNKIGTGWNKFEKIISVGSTLLGLDSEGDLYEFDFNASDNYWVLE